MSMVNNNKIFILAGESSSDLIGSFIMKGLKENSKELNFFGVGGSNMIKEGLSSVYEINSFNIIGFLNTIYNFKKLNKYLNEIVKLILKEKPKVVITIDTKGFSLALAKQLKLKFSETKFKCPLIHFVPPTIWAYGKSRIKKWKDMHDGLFCLFKKEEAILKKLNTKCNYVGNPVVEKVLNCNNKNDTKLINNKSYHNPKNINCLLLPGSRESELKYLLPEFISLIKSENPKFTYINWIIPTTKLQFDEVTSKIKKYNISTNTKVVILEENYELLKYADLAIACSGTITLELVLFKVPTIAIYKSDFLSAFIGRLLVDFQNVLLPNFLLGDKLVPFLFQEKYNSFHKSKLLIEFIDDIDNKKKKFRKYSQFILNNMGYKGTKNFDFTTNSSKEIIRIINNYNY
mgnify:FL=1